VPSRPSSHLWAVIAIVLLDQSIAINYFLSILIGMTPGFFLKKSFQDI
jgi:hypothetical protein